jgi:hypothetical protein
MSRMSVSRWRGRSLKRNARVRRELVALLEQLHPLDHPAVGLVDRVAHGRDRDGVVLRFALRQSGCGDDDLRRECEIIRVRGIRTDFTDLLSLPMKLGFFTMPMHPRERAPAQTLQEDREAIVLADRLGFYDAFVGEHLTDPEENITSSLIFLASLLSETKTIKLATGTSNLSHSHPVLIAAHAAMFDHLAQGRFIFGVSPGALASDAEALGILEEDRNRLFAEAMDVILAIWERNAPYDIAPPRQPLQGVHREDPGSRGRPRHDVQALPEAAPGDRRHGGGAAFEGRDRHGRARLSSAVGELPAAALAAQPLAELLHW